MTITEEGLRQFYGTEGYYRHWTGHLVYTDGVHYLVENGAAWLVDAIASHQINPALKAVPGMQDFQLWKLQVHKHPTPDMPEMATLYGYEDSDKPPVITQKIEFTDFPLEEIKLFVERGEELVLLLPSEH
jgi:hypothetical protein